MANFKNTNVVTYTTWDTCPLSTAGTGTITMNVATTMIKGTNTLFTSELQIGAWIWDGVYEVRKVTKIIDDTTCEVDKEFSLNQTIALKYIKMPRMVELFIYCKTATVLIDSASNSMVQGQTIPFHPSTQNQDSLMAPVVINASGGNAMATYKTGN